MSSCENKHTGKSNNINITNEPQIEIDRGKNQLAGNDEFTEEQERHGMASPIGVEEQYIRGFGTSSQRTTRQNT